MIDISPEALAPLIDPVPGGGIPAAWWVTLDPAHLREARVFEEAERTWDAAAEDLAAEAGSNSTGIRVAGGFGRSHLAGFQPVPDTDPATGWRVDSKKGLLVPSKRTKTDRECGSEERFNALYEVPTPGNFFSGIDSGFIAGDRFYRTQFRVYDSAVAAFVTGDPEEGARGDGFRVDDTWIRVPMSTFHLLRERKSAA